MYQPVKINKEVTVHDFSDKKEAIADVFSIWKNKGYAIVNYIYWSSYPLIEKIPDYRFGLTVSDILFPDGFGLYLFIKNTLGKKVNNLNGTDLNPLFLDSIIEQKIHLAFYGASELSLKKAVQNLEMQNKHIYYFQDGYSVLDWGNIADNSVLFVGLGSPLQECWVVEHLENIIMKKLLVITVGGYFDFLSGKYKRAPLWVRQLKSEWFWRAWHCDLSRITRNFLIGYYIIRDKKKIIKLNSNS